MSESPEAKQQESLATQLVLAQLQAELKQLRTYVAALEVNFRNTTLLGRLRRATAMVLGARLHKLHQYHSREMKIPAWYAKAALPENPPIISIVTPSYNQGQFLEKTITSVLDQGYPRLEYVVQDGGSKDDSVQVMEKYRSRLLHAESKRDKGQGNAINLGFVHANKGEIMAYLNSDDILLPGSLNYVASYFQAHPEVDVVYGHRIIIDQHDREVGRWVLPRHSDKMLVWADYIPQETMFWRRRIWDKVGGIDESFRFALDWDLLLRFRDAGAKFVRLPRFLGAFRLHITQKTSAEMSDVGTHEMGLLRQRVHGAPMGLEQIRKNLRGYMLAHVWHNWLYRLGLAHR
jgi:glycosyltransferase involved in cell wall biosynthesis